MINAAFNPAESFFVDGDRIDLDQVRQYFEKGVFLVAGEMAGCVLRRTARRARVFRTAQRRSRRGRRAASGRALIDAAEGYAREHGCGFMDIRIVNLRVELPAFYRKLGYKEAGTEEFHAGRAYQAPVPLHQDAKSARS